MKNVFLKNIILVAGGTAGAQVITMAFSPIITRLYTPDIFGLLGVFVAILGVVSPIAALSYPIAIVLPKSDSDAKGLVQLSLLVALVFSLSLSLLLLITGEKIAIFLNLQTIGNYMHLIPLAMFFSALQQIMQQWLIRRKEFKVTSRIALSQSLILNSCKTSIGLIYPTASTLILLTTFGNALYAFQLWYGEKKWSSYNNTIKKIIEPEKIKYLAKKYRDFPIYRTPQIVVNAVSQSLPIIILVSSFGPTAAGFFTLGRSVLAAPAILIGNSVSNVFYPTISELINNGKNPIKILKKSTYITFLIALGPFLILMLLGPFIFGLIFGENWTEAGEYARWMALWSLFSIAARPVIATIPAVEMQGFFLFYEVVFLVLKTIALVIGGHFYKSAILTISLYSIITALFYFTLFFIVLFLLKIKFKN